MMVKDENRKIYDVHRPQMVGAEPTSKPVIVGHQLLVPDPMLREKMGQGPVSSNRAAAENYQAKGETPTQPEPMTPVAKPAAGSVLSPRPEPAQQPTPSQSGGSLEVHLPSDKQTKANKGKEFLLWLIIILLVGAVIVGVYLAFARNKTKEPVQLSSGNPPATSSQTNQTNSTVSILGHYEIPSAQISFDYPKVWGTPTTTNDPGFAKRGGNNKSDGTYAYLVSFSTNKDVQLTVTSAKYLPAARTASYYDFLQWCVGNPDGKFYKETMLVNKVDKIDSPGNRVCSVGPLTGVTKLNDKTIVQLKTRDSSAKVIGDLYTTNLNNDELPALRVKDAAMNNSEAIKKLLASIVSKAASSQ